MISFSDLEWNGFLTLVEKSSDWRGERDIDGWNDILKIEFYSKPATLGEDSVFVPTEFLQLLF